MRLILIAGALALLFSLLGTPALIKVLARRGYGQFIRDDGPSTHHTKRGTPTMGGIIIIFATIFAYFIAHLLTQTAVTVSALLIIGLVLGLGFVGFLDDYLKVSRQNSRGISGKQKIFGQVLFASTFGYLGLHFQMLMASPQSRRIFLPCVIQELTSELFLSLSGSPLW